MYETGVYHISRSEVFVSYIKKFDELYRQNISGNMREVMQQTIMHYLLTIRISRAREFLIRFPDKKVLEIAKMCGFESPSYFGKKFKLETGMTPDTFRKKLG